MRLKVKIRIERICPVHHANNKDYGRDYDKISHKIRNTESGVFIAEFVYPFSQCVQKNIPPSLSFVLHLC